MKSALHAALWIAVLAAVSQVVGSILERSPLAALMISALAIDIASRRAGAAWDEPELPASTLARDLGLGVVIGAIPAVVAILAALAIGAGHVSLGSISLDGIALGLLRALALGYRDELLFRWAPSRLSSSLAGPIPRAIFCTLLGAAPTAFVAQERPAAVAVTLALGALCSVLMIRRQSFGLIVGAHAAVVLVTSTVFSSLLDTRWTSGSLVALDRADGTPGWILAACLAIGAVVAGRRARRATS